MLKVIDKDEYLAFALKNEYISIHQIPEWGELKKATGWKSHLLGFFLNEELLGVTLLLEKMTPIRKSLFYAPRGFLLDVNNLDILSKFTEELKVYIKQNKGFMLKVDPNVIYNLRDSEGNITSTLGEKALNNFKTLGYKHLGFTKNFETMQPRYTCRFKMQDTYELTFASFSKSTRKNIEKAIKMGVKTKEVDENSMDLFLSLLRETATTKKFVIRPASYYYKMYTLMRDYIKLYITYIDLKEYQHNLVGELNQAHKELVDVENRMERDHVGTKLKTSYEQINNKISKLNKEISEAKEMLKSKETINIGALMSIFIGNEGITMMSGTKAMYKSFNPKYSYYNEHIKECAKRKLQYCNFYGISGDMNPNSEYYSIYEIKKGFNPEIVELIGEFDLVLNPFVYKIYHGALKAYKLKKLFIK